MKKIVQQLDEQRQRKQHIVLIFLVGLIVVMTAVRMVIANNLVDQSTAVALLEEKIVSHNARITNLRRAIAEIKSLVSLEARSFERGFRKTTYTYLPASVEVAFTQESTAP